MMSYEHMMQLAMEQAKNAAKCGEVPVGAVLISESGELLSAACNSVIGHHDPCAHAEILALRKAGRIIGNYRLPGTVLCVTIEPCIMCMGAIVHARVSRVIYGARDPKWGAAGSLYDFSADARLNHHPEIIRGVCEAECREMMQAFFRERRIKDAC
ncbi:MAG: tRNA adenosine(34) deaminase TadA [Desulfobacterales bacterium]